MRSVWALAAILAGCGESPPADAGGSTTTSTTTSTSADDLTATASTGATPTTAADTTGGETTTTETCDPAITACTGGKAWLRAFPVAGFGFLGGPIEAAALAVAPDGDIVATGLYDGTIQFGDQAITSIGKLDVWVARFAPDGEPRWFRRFGGPDGTPGLDYAGANWSDGNIAFAPDGDILVTGTCIDTIDFGFGPLVGEALEPVVLRLSSTGEPRWARRHAGVDGSEFPLFIAPADDGRVWLAGTVYGPGMDLGGGVLHSAGWGDVMLAQLDADGNHLWSRRAGDAGHQELRSIAATPDGGLVIAGGIEGSLDLGNGPLISAGTRDAFVAHLDSDGQATWGHRYGDNYAQSSREVRVDADGDVHLAGDFVSTIDLGGGPFTSPEVEDPIWGPSLLSSLFLVHLGADGSHVWSAALPIWMQSFDRGDDGTLVLTGHSAKELTFPGGVSGSGDGPWVATLGPDASPRWQRILSDDEYTVAQAVAGPNGAAIVAFTIYGEVEFDGVTVGAPDQETFVLAQFGL